MSKTPEIELIQWASSCGINGAYARGHAWLHGTLIPAIEIATATTLSSHSSEESAVFREDVAIACSVIGDIHDANGAPLAAIQWYRRALTIDAGLNSAWRELGVCQSELGEFDSARLSLGQAIRLEPGDRWARDELESISDPGEVPNPMYRRGDPFWAAAEDLALDRPAQAIRSIRRETGVRAVQLRACAAGAADDTAGVILQVDEMVSMGQEVELSEQFWYFLPVALLRSRDLWERLAHLNLSADSVVPLTSFRLTHGLPVDESPRARIAAGLRAIQEGDTGQSAT